MTIPMWIYFVIVGIITSAFMAIKTGRKEREDEMESIELEGKVYMERIENERNSRKLRNEVGA
ncbi:sporulation YhaL family protein [Bacillus massilinigeriensis]|uniref:sporulation YhaL family protein n=1 Tax=Bacillus massilionigeriensis TaxID=1805475 RepID=UPI001570403C|nr:sporulation YhaL family protein [Bacillus massilionigeriensis]